MGSISGVPRRILLETSLVSIPKSHCLTRLGDPFECAIDGGLHEAFCTPFPSPLCDTRDICREVTPPSGTPSRVFAAHSRQDILCCAERDKHCKRDEPDADTKVGGYFCEGWYIRVVVAVRAAVSRGRNCWGGREMSKPEEVIDNDQDFGAQVSRLALIRVVYNSIEHPYHKTV